MNLTKTQPSFKLAQSQFLIHLFSSTTFAIDGEIDLYQVALRTEKISDEMAKTLADGFGVLVAVLNALATPEGEH